MAKDSTKVRVKTGKARAKQMMREAWKSEKHVVKPNKGRKKGY